MKGVRWGLEKSQKLKLERGVSFEEIVRGRLITALQHPKRSNQKLLLFEYQNYIWVVPYVEKKDELFLKTLFPSRKYTRKWKRGEI
jgi:hypothetical protein